MRKILLVFLLLAVPLAALYLFLSYLTGGVCFTSPTCTKDEVTLCHPTKEIIWQGPSLTSCGINAKVLKKRGWTECVIPTDFEGEIKEHPMYLIDIDSIKIAIPGNIELFIVPIALLSMGLGIIAFLWVKRK